MSQDPTRYQSLEHGPGGPQMSIMSQYETKKRRRGEPVTIHRQVFFEGKIYVIEEEVYSDSDHSSVYTSEDEFEVSDNLQLKFGTQNPLKTVGSVGGASGMTDYTAQIPRNLRSTASGSKKTEAVRIVDDDPIHAVNESKSRITL